MLISGWKGFIKSSHCILSVIFRPCFQEILNSVSLSSSYSCVELWLLPVPFRDLSSFLPDKRKEALDGAAEADGGGLAAGQRRGKTGDTTQGEWQR